MEHLRSTFIYVDLNEQRRSVHFYVIFYFTRLFYGMLLYVHNLNRFVQYAVRPSRGALGAFGCVYSCWLNFIHSNPNCEYPLLRRLGFVTPEYHHAHHREPKTHFSNVFRWI